MKNKKILLVEDDVMLLYLLDFRLKKEGYDVETVNNGKELTELCGITATSFIKLYNIPRALPKLQDLKYEMMPSETRLTDHLFLAGDTQLNASLNAAMISGERAALGVIESITSIV